MGSKPSHNLKTSSGCNYEAASKQNSEYSWEASATFFLHYYMICHIEEKRDSIVSNKSVFHEK